jgi:hypothetical protein
MQISNKHSRMIINGDKALMQCRAILTYNQMHPGRVPLLQVHEFSQDLDIPGAVVTYIPAEHKVTVIAQDQSSPPILVRPIHQQQYLGLRQVGVPMSYGPLQVRDVANCHAIYSVTR